MFHKRFTNETFNETQYYTEKEYVDNCFTKSSFIMFHECLFPSPTPIFVTRGRISEQNMKIMKFKQNFIKSLSCST
jgi:hypothetical protein